METQQLTERALIGASSSRSAEAHFLLKKGKGNGAVIMAYYAVECLLKAIIARNSLSGKLREEFFRHLNKYEMLVDAAGLGKKLRFAPDIHEKLETVASLRHDELRYNQMRYSKNDAEAYLKSAEEVMTWLRRHGLK